MSDWWIARRELGDGREVIVFELTFGRARLGINQVGEKCFDNVW